MSDTHIEKSLDEIKDSVIKLHDKLDPVIIDTALNKASLKRAWGFIITIGSGIVGICFFIIRGALKP